MKVSSEFVFTILRNIIPNGDHGTYYVLSPRYPQGEHDSEEIITLGTDDFDGDSPRKGDEGALIMVSSFVPKSKGSRVHFGRYATNEEKTHHLALYAEWKNKKQKTKNK